MKLLSHENMQMYTFIKLKHVHIYIYADTSIHSTFLYKGNYWMKQKMNKLGLFPQYIVSSRMNILYTSLMKTWKEMKGQ